MREFIHTEPGEPGSWRPSLQEIHSEMRIEYERCEEQRAPAVFLQIGIEGLERIEQFRGPEGKELVLRAVTDLLLAAPRNGDLHSYRYPGGVIAMLTETPGEAGEILARILVEGARQLELPEDRGTMRVSLCIGLAATQDEEFFFETMLQVAEEGSNVASASGGGCFAHTQLYGLHQRRLEREMPHRKLVSVARKEREEAEAKERAKQQELQNTSAPTAPPLPVPTSNGSANGNGSSVAAPGTNGGAIVDRPQEAEFRPVQVPEAVDFDGEMENLQDRLRDVLADDRKARGVTRKNAGTEKIEAQVMDIADRWVQAVLRKSLEAQAAEHRMEVALLERRVNKLDNALKESERELRRMANASSVDDGLHSAYRRVQGLDEHEDNFETKNSLMEQILQANLELYSKISLN